MKSSLQHLDSFRVKDPPSEPGATYGAFIIPSPFKRGEQFEVIAADGSDTGWDHVSCKVRLDHRITRIPVWREMDWLKQQFWDDAEVVVQFHVNGQQKVNKHHSVLHLWKPVSGSMPMPPIECV